MIHQFLTWFSVQLFVCLFVCLCVQLKRNVNRSGHTFCVFQLMYKPYRNSEEDFVEADVFRNKVIQTKAHSNISCAVKRYMIPAPGPFPTLKISQSIGRKNTCHYFFVKFIGHDCSLNMPLINVYVQYICEMSYSGHSFSAQDMIDYKFRYFIAIFFTFRLKIYGNTA